MKWFQAIALAWQTYKIARAKQKAIKDTLTLEDRIRITSETADEYNEQLRRQAD